MSRGFARNDNDAAARGYEPFGRATVSNANQFKKLALQHCSGMIAQINKAESCVPGITSDALKHAKLVLASLQGTLLPGSSKGIQWPPVMPKDEEE